jgi:PAS domain S-box-containing protein
MRGLKRWFGIGFVALLGVAMLTVPVYDIAADVIESKSLLSAIIENAPLLTLSAIVLGGAGWLARSDWQESYVLTAVGWMAGVSAFAAGLLALVVGIQLFVQSDLKPIVIAADGVLVAATAGLLVGILAAQRKRAQEGQFEALFENVPNPVVAVKFVDGEAIVQRVNTAFIEMFGYDTETIIGESLESYIVPENQTFDPVERPEEAPTDQRGIWERETFRLETEDGRREFIRVTVPVTLGASERSYGIYIDITDQRQRRERLQVLGRTLRHDLRNKLQVISGMASSLETRLESENSEYASDIHDAATELLDISERTRRAEKLLTDERQRESTALVTTVEDAVASVTEDHDVDITTDLPDAAYADTVPAFSVAIEEILTNAVEHNDTDVPCVEISIAESLSGKYYDIRIADNGPGIDPREYEVIKGEREFSQIDHATGVGLWTAYWILRESGGELSFEANTPRGTIVTLRVPRTDENGGPTVEGTPSGMEAAD